MNIELVLVAASLHILIWDKLPDWFGAWHDRALAALPPAVFGLELAFGWFFDAMAGAILIVTLMLVIHALRLPGMKARLLEAEMTGEPKDA